MTFITNIDKNTYDNFVLNHKKRHFLQSYNWGKFAELEKGLIPHYVGEVDDNNNLVCSALLLEKKLPMGYSYFYSPRGYVIDFENKELLKKFTEDIKSYTKKYKAIFIKIDPDLVIERTNYLDEKIDPDYDKNQILSTLKGIGFKHLGFTQRFETMQPRYSFRIDCNNPLEKIIDDFSKTTKQRIKKANELEVEVKIGNEDNIDDFYKLMKLTENRKDFVTHNLSYYKTLYNLFKDNDGANLFLGIVNLENIINKYNNELSTINNEIDLLEKLESRSKTQNNKLKELNKSKERLTNDIEKYVNYRKEYGQSIILNGHFIIKYGDMAWVLYAGNHNILTDTYSNYKTYLEHITYYHDKVKIYDQFGTVGNIDHNDHLYGLHEFKKKFGGDYVEFIGEFDLIQNKLMYFIFTKLVPIYRNIIKSRAKKKNRR